MSAKYEIQYEEHWFGRIAWGDMELKTISRSGFCVTHIKGVLRGIYFLKSSRSKVLTFGKMSNIQSLPNN
jgi:hypothetical protein